ncbi:DUF6153 family protein [Streptomyces sp. 549]|uniref:DUF6153 family protein n=1 Tax=Streptomyces sp. 549 TaxID=3049076 RepID=UPI0024C26CA9|nr:DUF6153 family protein [Streptomyces sp. 549]MDK1475476.1 DUF6153 family protein [Streptomyces sp. 549]
MTSRAQLQRTPSPPRWWPALLVFGLLAGLFGMHGLAPGGAIAASSHHASDGHQAPDGGHHASAGHRSPAAVHGDAAGVVGVTDAVGVTGVVSTESVCHGGLNGSGHAQHADSTCSSGAVRSGPDLPVLLPDPAGRVALPAVGHRSTEAEPEGGRAPPSLAELQLLRI